MNPPIGPLPFSDFARQVPAEPPAPVKRDIAHHRELQAYLHKFAPRRQDMRQAYQHCLPYDPEDYLTRFGNENAKEALQALQGIRGRGWRNKRRAISLRRVLGRFCAVWRAPENDLSVIIFGVLMLIAWGLLMLALHGMGVMP